MRKILIIGIGAGDPEYVTVQAINALNRVDAFFIPDKGTERKTLRACGLRYASDTSGTGPIVSSTSRRQRAPTTVPTIN